jgi:cytochrome c oxidase assembly protein subunit 15
MNDTGAAVFSIADKKNNRAVGYWLLIGVGMVIIQVALGGITRLTGSGLSITEWNVVTGTFPPLSTTEWMEEFAKYKSTPQFKLLNTDFTLSDFKFIFFWEWLHRVWARLLGLVFAAGFIYFLATKKFNAQMIRPLLVLFALGALQGLVGWIMVASGLTGDAVYVQPTKLALHFIFALVLLCYTFWFALKLLVPNRQRLSMPNLKNLQVIIFILLFFQLIYGALMAGHKAATAAPTWPDINGSVLSPAGIVTPGLGLLNLVENKIMVHVLHRGLAYFLLILVILFSYRLSRAALTSLTKKTRWYPAIIVSLQVVLGIITVLTSIYVVPGRWGTFEWMAQLHQLNGMLLLLSMVWMLYLTTGSARAANHI